MMNKTVFILTLVVLLAIPALGFCSEANLLLPNLKTVNILGVDGKDILTWGLLLCVAGLLFGFLQYSYIQKLPVHRSMREVSELIYATCKTYLITQGKFLIILELLIGTIISIYFGLLQHLGIVKVLVILACSMIGILGSYLVAWFGMRVNTMANGRTAFSSLRGNPYDAYHIPLKAGMSIGMMLISLELLVMLGILLFIKTHIPDRASSALP
jgi:K(+)-stimulated pyrophosphate-energized sodium pump